MNRNYIEFRDAVINAINQSGLELGAAYFVLKDVSNQVYNEFVKEVNKERDEEMAKIKEMQEAAMKAAESANDEEAEDIDV